MFSIYESGLASFVECLSNYFAQTGKLVNETPKYTNDQIYIQEEPVIKKVILFFRCTPIRGHKNASISEDYPGLLGKFTVFVVENICFTDFQSSLYESSCGRHVN